MNQYIDDVERRYVRDDLPEIRVGDTVKVHFRIKEGERERIQPFEGVIIRIRGGGTRTTFTVRKVSYGIGVERIFPLHSPLIEKIEVLRRARVRRARLYYLRERVGRKAKLKELRTFEKAIRKEETESVAEGWSANGDTTEETSESD